MTTPTPPLEDLYQKIILDHSKNPRNEGELAPCDCEAEGFNPLCGDRVHIFQRGEKIQFTASGCAIARASASILTTATPQLDALNLEKNVETVLEYLISDGPPPESLADSDEFAALAAVRQFPARIKCAALPWNTLLAALRK